MAEKPNTTAPMPTTATPMALEAQSQNSLRKIDTKASEIYDNIPMWRKCIVVFVLSWSVLSASFSSTSLLSASTEIARDLQTTEQVAKLSTSGLVFAMGLSPLIWCPIARIIGRRMAYTACLAVLMGFTVGAALAPSAKIYVTMRIMAGIQGCYFHVAGQTILAEYFPPVQRGTANGFFLAGNTLGPPLGPLVAGIMMTYTTWRSIMWLQVAMIGVAFVLAVIFVPAGRLDQPGLALNLRGWQAVATFNPLPVFKQMRYPNISLTHLSCGFLSWSQYSVLSAPRHILSTRFLLTSPISSGLFYIAPATGFLLGTVVGGRYSDMTVRKWIDRRGERLPQDRLNSGMLAFFVIIPLASLLYGWGLQCNSCSTEKVGLALPIVTSFFTAAGLLAAFASLNTYCAEAIPKKRGEVIAGKYIVQYTFAALATSQSIPLMQAVGVGPASTIGVILVLIAGCLTFLTAKYASSMEAWADDTQESTKQAPWPQ
ncbi:putative MFS transporter [Dothidotthia symphoricarpi CBS 119687]|uniref:Putative MFS transporter n=1 Tax=Dothidotthia symphoricarpi CBS 119687 TaxID=1392245 RepID=A0A6A6AE76_9PLEO|nr:putative MFS transporter [Dothidotthia symphoricarpi CBS 119687]KAF2129405.1 putative MFS transporter [Dothidotthia symphoricarpi CBS 119687]